jgi:hypothetical protein
MTDGALSSAAITRVTSGIDAVQPGNLWMQSTER